MLQLQTKREQQGFDGCCVVMERKTNVCAWALQTVGVYRSGNLLRIQTVSVGVVSRILYIVFAFSYEVKR